MRKDVVMDNIEDAIYSLKEWVMLAEDEGVDIEAFSYLVEDLFMALRDIRGIE